MPIVTTGASFGIKQSDGIAADCFIIKKLLRDYNLHFQTIVKKEEKTGKAVRRERRTAFLENVPDGRKPVR